MSSCLCVEIDFTYGTHPIDHLIFWQYLSQLLFFLYWIDYSIVRTKSTRLTLFSSERTKTIHSAISVTLTLVLRYIRVVIECLFKYTLRVE